MIDLGLLADGRLAFLIPIDDIFWTEGIAEAATRPYAEAGSDLEIRSREVWFRGGVSARCRQELEGLGWSVFAEADLASGGRGSS